MTTSRHAWTYTLPSALLLMAPFDILASLAMDIFLPVVPAMPGILNTTPSMIQLALSLYMVTLGVGQVVFGPLSDRVGRRPVLLAGGALFAAASLGAACSSTAGDFLAFRLLQAVGASAALVATFATVRDVYADRPENAVIYGLFSSMLAFVPAIGPVAGALIAESFGWRAIFVTLVRSQRWPSPMPASGGMRRVRQSARARAPRCCRSLRVFRSGSTPWASVRAWDRSSSSSRRPRVS